jgi:hypothetical protein
LRRSCSARSKSSSPAELSGKEAVYRLADKRSCGGIAQFGQITSELSQLGEGVHRGAAGFQSVDSLLEAANALIEGGPRARPLPFRLDFVQEVQEVGRVRDFDTTVLDELFHYLFEACACIGGQFQFGVDESADRGLREARASRYLLTAGSQEFPDDPAEDHLVGEFVIGAFVDARYSSFPA